MKKLIAGALFCAGLMAGAPLNDHVPGRLLVQHRLGADNNAVSQAVKNAGARIQSRLDRLNVSVLQVPEPAADRIAAALMRTGLFTFVEKDFLAHTANTPNDPDFSSQWHLTAIQGPNAWNVTIGASTVTIAVIDAGADITHPDLASKLVPGWNFLTGTATIVDNTGHGTAVSGTAAAATDNATGVAGVAWTNMVMPLVVVDSTGSASYSNIANAITYAADHGARIMNISIAGTSASSTLQNAVNYAWSKGAVIFAAAGNASSSTPEYPAACTNVVSVSATDQNNNLASFSNYGSWIDLAAPGTSILTTTSGGGYGAWQGTSFSSPIAAAVGALVLSVQPALSNSALVSILEKNAIDLGTAGWDQYFGYGLVNAYTSVIAAQTAAVDTTPPAVSISSPAAGATVSGTMQVQGTATDNVGVTSIQFNVDSQQVATASTSPFAFLWNTANSANGTHILTVYAYDAAGNVGSASATVTVNNPVVIDTQPPVVTITQPLNGSKVFGNLKIGVSATDNVAVAQVAIYVDNILRCSDTAAPYTCQWNTNKASSGTHVITATAWDTSGNSASATPVTVTK